MDKIDPTEKLHLKFCKSILGVHTKATNLAVYAELGHYPLLVDKLTTCMKYITYIETETENKLLKKFYNCIVDNQELMNQCSLLKMQKQLNVFIDTRPIIRKGRSTHVFFQKIRNSL